MIKFLLFFAAIVTTLIGVFFWKYIEATPWLFVSNLCLWVYLCLDRRETQAMLKCLDRRETQAMLKTKQRAQKEIREAWGMK